MSGSGSKPFDERQVREWMMAAIDDELSAEDRARLDALLETDETLRAEWNALRGVRNVTATLALREPPEEIWDGYWQDTYRHFERGVGWVLFSLGALSIMAFGLWQWLHMLWAESDLPAWLRVALFVMSLGGGVLVISVFREKWFTWKRDPYKEVRR